MYIFIFETGRVKYLRFLHGEKRMITKSGGGGKRMIFAIIYTPGCEQRTQQFVSDQRPQSLQLVHRTSQYFWLIYWTSKTLKLSRVPRWERVKKVVL